MISGSPWCSAGTFPPPAAISVLTLCGGGSPRSGTDTGPLPPLADLLVCGIFTCVVTEQQMTCENMWDVKFICYNHIGLLFSPVFVFFSVLFLHDNDLINTATVSVN